MRGTTITNDQNARRLAPLSQLDGRPRSPQRARGTEPHCPSKWGGVLCTHPTGPLKHRRLTRPPSFSNHPASLRTWLVTPWASRSVEKKEGRWRSAGAACGESRMVGNPFWDLSMVQAGSCFFSRGRTRRHTWRADGATSETEPHLPRKRHAPPARLAFADGPLVVLDGKSASQSTARRATDTPESTPFGSYRGSSVMLRRAVCWCQTRLCGESNSTRNCAPSGPVSTLKAAVENLGLHRFRFRINPTHSKAQAEFLWGFRTRGP